MYLSTQRIFFGRFVAETRFLAEIEKNQYLSNILP